MSELGWRKANIVADAVLFIMLIVYLWLLPGCAVEPEPQTSEAVGYFHMFDPPPDAGIEYHQLPSGSNEYTYTCGQPGACDYHADWTTQHAVCKPVCGFPAWLTSGSTYNSLGCVVVSVPGPGNPTAGICIFTDKTN